MEGSKQQLINVWKRNQLANEQILDEIDDQNVFSSEHLKNIYTQFAHIHTIRYYNIEKQNSSFLQGLKKMTSKDSLNDQRIRKQLQVSSDAIISIIEEKDWNTIKSYSNGMLGWIIYLINHESHHRSKVIQRMKDEEIVFTKNIKFDLWNWK